MTTCSEGLDTGFVALGYARVALLGIVQGVTELLPISSTAHMRVVPSILGWPDPGSAFSAVMQLAALTAVLSYFRTDIRTLLVESSQALRLRNFAAPSVRLIAGILIGTLPIVIAGALLGPSLNACGSPLRNIVNIGVACLVMALLLGLSERYASHRRELPAARMADLLLIGVAQAGALIPGVSRSGSTLTAGLSLGFAREDAAKLSFLLGLPAIALAGTRELWLLANVGLNGEGWAILMTGLAVASLSAFAAIWGLMRYLERFSTWPFVMYRALLGMVLIYGGIAGGLH
jgi:undecaprenyl-diphosphatase